MLLNLVRRGSRVRLRDGLGVTCECTTYDDKIAVLTGGALFAALVEGISDVLVLGASSITAISYASITVYK